MVITLPGGVSPSVEWVWKELWLSETTKIQKCLHKLLNNHIDFDIVLWLWFWPTMHRGKRQTFFTSNHITLSPWVDSRTTSGTSCPSLPTTDQNRRCLPLAGADMKEHRFRKTCCSFFSSYKFAILLNSYHHHYTTDNLSTLCGPVMWLCRFKCRVLFDRQLSPTLGSPNSALIG